ncbi:hypothetical protein [Streptomyces sp. CA-179760]
MPSQAFAELPARSEGHLGRALPESVADAPNATVVKSLAEKD